jgi:transposase InsO family protein
MKLHANAPHGPRGRAEMVRRVVQGGQTARAVAEDFGVSERTVRKWVGRFRAEGQGGLQDRTSRPHHMPTATPEALRPKIEALRRQRWTGARLAERFGVGRATMHRILRRLGLERLRKLEPRPPVQRYERARPGELLHLDVKKLARIGRVGHRITGDRRRRVRGIGWEYAHVCVDDASRAAYVEVLPDEQQATTRGFLQRAATWLGQRGISIQRVMTDNGPAYRSQFFRATCQGLGARQLFTRPYTPQTNGKAERFIQTLQREWAYGRVYRSSRERRAWLPRWLHYYNCHRAHAGLAGCAPITRLVPADNLVAVHS